VRHCDLGYLERYVAAVATDPGADVDQGFAQAGQRTLPVFGIARERRLDAR